MFQAIKRGPADPMYDLKKKADGDTTADKVDLGVGIYRSEQGVYQQLKCVKEAKEVLAQNDPGHDVIRNHDGKRPLLDLATEIMFGKDSPRVASKTVASVQTISGTGAVHLAAELVALTSTPPPAVYIGVPAWGNYKPLFKQSGIDAVEYNYYDAAAQGVDFASVLGTARAAPERSVFILQGCCHNPTGADLTRAQWDELARVIKEKGHLPLFDVAYQGLGDGLDEDVYAVRSFAALGLDMMVCQSFSKNFALYGERCGALHVVCPDVATTEAVHDRLRCLIRWEFSSSPAFGSRLVTIVRDSEKLSQEWVDELASMRARLKGLRQRLCSLLVEELKTPGSWSHITRETGLFSYLPLTPAQCKYLVDNYHIYLPSSGRITIPGLNQNNIERVARSIDQVVRETAQ